MNKNYLLTPIPYIFIIFALMGGIDIPSILEGKNERNGGRTMTDSDLEKLKELIAHVKQRNLKERAPENSEGGEKA